MVALIPNRCSSGHSLLVVLAGSNGGAGLPEFVSRAASAIGAEPVVADQAAGYVCPVCGAREDASDDAVVRVYEQLASADLGEPSLN